MRNGCAQVRKAARRRRQPKKELGRLEAPEEVEVPEDEKKDPAVKNMEDMHAALLAAPGALRERAGVHREPRQLQPERGELLCAVLPGARLQWPSRSFHGRNALSLLDAVLLR